MRDLDKLGYIGPRDPFEPPKKDTPLDIEKFKKVLKTEESTEAEQRKKRRAKKEEEAEEEEAQTTQTAPEATVQFKEFMKDEKGGISPFAEQVKSPVRKLERTEHFNLIEEGKPKKTGLEGPLPKISEEEEARFMERLPESTGRPLGEAETPSYPGEEVEEAAPPPPPIGEWEEYPSAPTSPAEAPKEKAEKVSEKKKIAPIKKKEAAAAPKKIEKKKEVVAPIKKMPEKLEKAKPLSPEKKDVFFKTFAPQGKETPIPEEKKIVEEVAKIPAEAPAENLPLKAKEEEARIIEEKKKKEEKVAAPEAAPAPIHLEIPMEIPTPTISHLPGAVNLPPQVYELFERMVGLMTIESLKGVTRTTVTLNMKNSVFNGAQIILDHYSTAPNAFNVTLAGSPQAVNYFNANVTDLIAALQQSKLSFEVHMQKPLLLPEFRALQRDEEKKERKKRKKKEE